MRSNNPYHLQGYVDPSSPHYLKLYVKRDGLEDEVIGRLDKADRPLGSYLFGPRQSGKTSLLHYLSTWQQQHSAWNCAHLAPNRLEKDTEHTWYRTQWTSLVAQLKAKPFKEKEEPSNRLGAK